MVSVDAQEPCAFYGIFKLPMQGVSDPWRPLQWIICISCHITGAWLSNPPIYKLADVLDMSKSTGSVTNSLNSSFFLGLRILLIFGRILLEYCAYCRFRISQYSIWFWENIDINIIFILQVYINYVQVCLDNSDLYNSESAITRTIFERWNPGRQLNYVSITRNPL